MMPLITDIPQADEQFRKTFTTEKIEPMNTGYPLSRAKYHCSYTITTTDMDESFRHDYALASTAPLSFLGGQSTIIMLANELFKGSKPLGGREMDIVNNTFSRLRSTVPTKF